MYYSKPATPSRRNLQQVLPYPTPISRVAELQWDVPPACLDGIILEELLKLLRDLTGAGDSVPIKSEADILYPLAL